MMVEPLSVLINTVEVLFGLLHGTSIFSLERSIA